MAPRVALVALVLAHGASALADAPAPAAGPARLWSRGQTTWIYEQPRATKNALGYVRLGQSVELRAEAPVKGPGCSGAYHAVQPYGWPAAASWLSSWFLPLIAKRLPLT